MDLQKQIDQINARNLKVQADKAWEVSGTRRLIVFLLTYLCVAIFFVIIELKNPFLNALVPALAFVLSTMTLPFCKRLWIRKIKK